MLQSAFKDVYVEELRRQITPSAYAKEIFEFDPSQRHPIAGVEKPEGLLEKMDPENDFLSAIALYEAYPDIPPIVACQTSFWAYLSHVDLFPYMQKRFPDVLNGKADEDYIVRNWFRNPDSREVRTPLPGFWWSVSCSIDELRDKDHKYDLTKILFRSADIRTHYFCSSSIFRHHEAAIGILEFLEENENITGTKTHFKNCCIWISRYFNRLGAIKQLSYFNRDFFKNELEKNIPTLRDISNRDKAMTL